MTSAIAHIIGFMLFIVSGTFGLAFFINFFDMIEDVIEHKRLDKDDVISTIGTFIAMCLTFCCLFILSYTMGW